MGDTTSPRTGGRCVACGETYIAGTLRAADAYHREVHGESHPFSPATGNGFVVVTDNTLAEIEHPSGEVADREQTGANDRYSNQ